MALRTRRHRRTLQLPPRGDQPWPFTKQRLIFLCLLITLLLPNPPSPLVFFVDIDSGAAADGRADDGQPAHAEARRADEPRHGAVRAPAAPLRRAQNRRECVRWRRRRSWRRYLNLRPVAFIPTFYHPPSLFVLYIFSFLFLNSGMNNLVRWTCCTASGQRLAI